MQVSIMVYRKITLSFYDILHMILVSVRNKSLMECQKQGYYNNEIKTSLIYLQLSRFNTINHD